MKNPYQVKIGMEIHSEIKTKRKMFCFCPNNPFEVKANTNVCPICLAHPGTLPIINKKAIEMVILASQALNCQIAKITKFDRKNYFYPDLPKGYQISQYDLPIGFNGFLPLKEKKIRIRRIHLEEDAGKLIHPQGKNYSLVDFNRAGVPLLELVSEPDIESAKEAKEFCQELQRVFRYLEISDADLEKGQMRCEVNISLTKNNSLGTKVEIKNLGSFKAVEQAIEYEIKRQRKLLVKGEKIKQETRGWDKEKGITYPQRSKEESADYRYFPEPDLPFIETDSFDLKKISSSLPELPWQKRERLKKQFPSLKEEEIEILVSERKQVEFFEEAVSEIKNYLQEEKIEKEKIAKTLVNFILSDLRGLLIKENQPFSSLKFKAKDFAYLLSLFLKGKINSRIVKDVLRKMYLEGKKPEDIFKEEKITLISEKGDLEKIVEEVIKENEKAVADYKKGKENALQFLVGQIMKKTKGGVEPKTALEVIREKIQ